MWEGCWPLHDDDASEEQFVLIREWTVPAVGEVAVAGQPLWLRINSSTVAIRFSKTWENTAAREPTNLPQGCLVLSGGALFLEYPPPLPKLRKPPRELGYDWLMISWRAASDELRVISIGVTLTYQGGMWRWVLTGDA